MGKMCWISKYGFLLKSSVSLCHLRFDTYGYIRDHVTRVEFVENLPNGATIVFLRLTLV